MLTVDEKKHIKDILSDGLGINRNINLAYFLTLILETKNNASEIISRIERIEYEQRNINDKLDRIIRLIRG